MSLCPEFRDAYFQRGEALFRAGDTEGAEKDWLKTVELGQPGPFDPDFFTSVLYNSGPYGDVSVAANFNLACLHSVKAEQADTMEIRAQHVDTALAYVEAAIKEGLNHPTQFKLDRDLDGIRDEPRFKELIKQLERD